MTELLEDQLWQAAFNGDCDDIAKLILAGANPDTFTGFPRAAKSLKGVTPLMIAAVRGNHECVRLLCEVSDLAKATELGDTALDLAYQFQQDEVYSIIEEFILASVEMAPTSKRGMRI